MKRSLEILRLVVAVGLLVYMLRRIDVTSAMAHALDANLGLIIVGTLVLALQPVIGAIRWRTILVSSRSVVALGSVIRWTYIGVFFGQVLPATVGADGLRVWYAARHAVGIKNAVTSVTLDRVGMVLTLIGLLCFGTPFLRHYVDGAMLTFLLVGLVGGSLAGLGALMLGDQLPISLYRFRVARGIAHLARDAKALYLDPVSGMIVLGLCLLGYLTIMTSIYLFARAFGASISAFDILVLMPPVLVASMLPISLGGWGTREVAMVAALGTVNISPDTALLTSLWLGLGSIVIALPGGLFFLSGSRRLPGTSADALNSDAAI